MIRQMSLAILTAALIGGCAVSGQKMVTSSSMGEVKRVSRTDTPPRKVVVATSMTKFSGDLEKRMKNGVDVVEEMAAEAKKQGKKLDLAVLPEYALMSGKGKFGAEQAVPVDGIVGDTFGGLAKKHQTYLVVPMIMKEADSSGGCSNAAVMFGRDGKVAGIYRKFHVVADLDVADEKDSLEGGLMPGRETPVFDCDFGKVGMQICWDNVYENGWEQLAKKGAEIVVWPTASPANIRAQWWAQKYQYYVVSATPRDNAAIFNPTGLITAQISPQTGKERVLVKEIDLSYAILGWTAPLHDGKTLKDKFGDKVDFQYSPREDQGLFWSNDPKMTIGQMVRSLKLLQLNDHVVESKRREEAARAALKKVASN